MLLVFIVSGLYIIAFLQSIDTKLKLYLTLPVTTKQLANALYFITLRTMGLLLLFVLPFYLIACSFDEVSVPMSENITLYVAVTGNTLLYISVFIWLFFKMKERSYVTLTQFVALLLITLMTFSILTTLERIHLYVGLQIGLFTGFYAAIIFYVYKRTVTAIAKFNIR